MRNLSRLPDSGWFQTHGTSSALLHDARPRLSGDRSRQCRPVARALRVISLGRGTRNGLKATSGAIVVATLALAGCGSGTPADHSASIADSITARSCTATGYEITFRTDNSKTRIYDCTMLNGAEKCVVEQNGLVTDETALAKILFQNELSGGKPLCAT